MRLDRRKTAWCGRFLTACGCGPLPNGLWKRHFLAVWLGHTSSLDGSVVFLLALVLRLAYTWQQGLPVPVVGDALEYHDYALHLVESGRYVGPQGALATRMPGYPLFLAAIRLVFGGALAPILAAQCLMGALTCLLVYRLALRLLPAPWPLCCGLIAAAYFDLIAPSALLLSECLYSFFLVLSVCALFKQEWPPGRRALAFGALSGCLYLIRPEPLPYILATTVLLPWLPPGPGAGLPGFGRREILKALMATALITGLWVGRNFMIFHRLVPASSVGKHVAYLSLFLPAEQQGLVAEGRHRAPAGASELEREADFASAYRELAGRLTWKQIAGAYLYNLLSILYPFLPAYDWTYVALIPFWLLGMWKAARRRELWPLAGAVVCSISVLTFFGGPASRYRQGVAPFLVLLSAVGMHAAVVAVGSTRLRAGLGGWLGINLLVWIFAAQSRLLVLGLKSAVLGLVR